MRSEYIKKDAFERLFSALPYNTALCARLCLETGMRVGDAVALTPESLKKQKVSYIAQKTGKKDTKPLSKALYRELLAVCGENFVFESRKAKSGHLTRQAVWKAVKKAALLAGETANVTPHSARKVYAVELRKAEGLKATQAALQHSNADTTALYAFSDVALGGRVSSGELERLIDTIAKRTAREVLALLTNRANKRKKKA